jgi:hypothetical protein
MAPKDMSLVLGMVSLMLHFHWNWVGLVVSRLEWYSISLTTERKDGKKQSV